MPKAAVLILRLAGPLQSWGERSRWDVRDTADRPTKSGVVGLLGAAIGYPRGDQRLLRLQEAFRFGVRVDKPGHRLVDFQTVTGALPSADGKAKGSETNPYTIITPRAYLQDASFLIGLEGEVGFLRTCAEALSTPKWPYFLGRKCCPPTEPLFREILEQSDLESALTSPHTFEGLEGKDSVALFLEEPEGDQEMRDRSLGNPAREYGLTRYRTALVQIPKGELHVS